MTDHGRIPDEARPFGGCPRLISDRFKATFPVAIAEEAAAVAAAIRGGPVRAAAAPEGARLVVPLDPKAGDADAAVARLVAAFEDLERRSGGATVSLEREQWYADEDRDARHPDQFRPFLAAPGLLVAPAWLARDPAPGEVVLALDPGAAFGSGYHASTRLALGLLRERTAAVVPRRMLDVGTGTGILALAGAIWGAAEVTAVDVKPEAVAAARANAARNGLAARVRVGRRAAAARGGLFDLDRREHHGGRAAAPRRGFRVPARGGGRAGALRHARRPAARGGLRRLRGAGLPPGGLARRGGVGGAAPRGARCEWGRTQERGDTGRPRAYIERASGVIPR